MAETAGESSGPQVEPGSHEPPRSGLYKRFFAWLLSRLQKHYPEEIEHRKRELLAQVHGTVVEIGAGTGSNLEFYPAGVGLRLVEPNGHMHDYLREAAEERGVRVEIRGGTAEHMDVESASVDFVVCTLVLCSVDSLEATLSEVVRTLKPGGKFIFLEHVAAPTGTARRRWQRRLRRFWRTIGDGCTLDRETLTSIEQAGFADVEVEHFDTAGFPLVRSHICGVAMTASRSPRGAGHLSAQN